MASFAGWQKRIPLEPSIASLEDLRAEVGRVFAVPPSSFRLQYRDVEQEEIEIQDQLDFEYFLSLAKEAPLLVHVLSDGLPPPSLGLTPAFPPDHKVPEAPPAPLAPLTTEEDTILQELNADPDRHTAERNLKTLNECLSDAEVLSDLKQKVDSIRQLMEQSVSDIKNELVRTKRKNSGVVSREIDSPFQHLKVTCSNCGLTPIHGKRYKCVVCKGFELCEVCEENNFHSQHPMIRLVESVRGPAYYEELAQLLKLSMGNLKTQDVFVKKRLLKMMFGEHVSNDTVDVILNSRGKITAEEVLLEFHKLLV